MNHTKGQQLNSMLLLVTNAFDGIFDKGGQPYVLHCLKVMHYLKSDDEELNCIALGHDYIEDIHKGDIVAGRAALEALGFSERIIVGIIALTKIPGESYEDYQARVMANPDAIKVKMCDLRHNSDIRRLKGKVLRPKDIERTIKYYEFYSKLEDLA